MCCSIYSLTEVAGWRVLKGIFGGKVGGGSYNRCSQAWEEFGLNMNWSITAEFRLIDCEVFPINQTYLGFETRSLWWWLMARARAGNKTFYARLEVSQKSIDPSQPIEVVRTHIVIWYLHILHCCRGWLRSTSSSPPMRRTQDHWHTFLCHVLRGGGVLIKNWQRLIKFMQKSQWFCEA